MTAIERQRELLAAEHVAHHGHHQDYECRFAGPHCWGCGEPWPCRTSRGVAAVNDRAALLDVVEAAEKARDLVANYLWNEDGEDEEWLHDAHDDLRAALDRLHAEAGWSEE